MSEPTWKLKKFTIGLRHERTFGISDVRGYIADAAVAISKKSRFPKGGFSKITTPDALQIGLHDKSGDIYLNCNVDGIILQVSVDDDPSFTTKKTEDLFVQVSREVLELAEVKDTINRVGVVCDFDIVGFSNSAKACYEQFMAIGLNGVPDNAVLRVAVKHPTIGPLLHPDKIGDYENFILNLSSERDVGKKDDEEGEELEEREAIPTVLKVSADYQFYYIPPKSFKNISFAKNFADAMSFIEGTVKKIPITIE